MAHPLEDAPDRPELSVVVPTYGGQRTLPVLVDRLRKALDGQSFEIILVHDCGPDDSWATISELAKADDRIRGINLRKNFGQHNAVMAGLNYARGDAIVTMDDDLQHSPDDIGALREKLNEGYDVCYARFTSRKHASWKVFGSKVNDWLARLLLGKPKGIYLSPYRCLSRGIRDELVKFKGPSVYVDGLINAITDNIASVDVAHQERSKGESQYTFRKSISLLLKMATSGSIFPLRLASLLGLLTSFVGFVLALVFAIQRIEDPTLPIGWASLIVTSLFLGGVQLLALGILGEYIGGLFLRVDARPQYVIAETANVRTKATERRKSAT
jgi:undecaprenyl-phosphate 4-deoxy-4-formamido-L-arabinose transferase